MMRLLLLLLVILSTETVFSKEPVIYYSTGNKVIYLREKPDEKSKIITFVNKYTVVKKSDEKLVKSTNQKWLLVHTVQGKSLDGWCRASELRELVQYKSKHGFSILYYKNWRVDSSNFDSAKTLKLAQETNQNYLSIKNYSKESETEGSFFNDNEIKIDIGLYYKKYQSVNEMISETLSNPNIKLISEKNFLFKQGEGKKVIFFNIEDEEEFVVVFQKYKDYLVEYTYYNGLDRTSSDDFYFIISTFEFDE
jgi:hypothetical protein